VLSLVVLTENSNGGVSYLSLVPQNWSILFAQT
jgi:hypothetical protein